MDRSADIAVRQIIASLEAILTELKYHTEFLKREEVQRNRAIEIAEKTAAKVLAP